MRKLLLSMLFAGLCLPAGAETYKCVVGGKVRYTNQTPGANDKCEMALVRKPPVTLSVEAPSEGSGVGANNAAGKLPTAKAQGEKTLADKALEEKLKKSGADEARKIDEEKQAQQAAKAQNCKSAKMNVETLKMGRVSRVNEKGEKYFLDEAAIAEELEQANKGVETWCN